MHDFKGVKILVVGDIMLDKYYFGDVERVSPEAPVPVVKVRETRFSLGGAANVANNIVHLDASAMLIGLVGNDVNRRKILSLAGKSGIETNFIVTSYPTIVKTRVIGDHQQIVRLDYEEQFGMNEEELEEFKEKFSQHVDGADCVIISDFGKGFITNDTAQYIITNCRKRSKKVIVDPKGRQWEKYRDSYMVTPNFKEFSDVAGADVENKDKDIEVHGKRIIEKFDLGHLLVTRSEKGMSLISKDRAFHIRTEAKEVFDVSGAGDTVVATLSAALAKDYNLESAVELANKAAGIIVSKIGTSPITIEELLLSERNTKLVGIEELLKLIKNFRLKKKKIVFTNGCFDILHKGHLLYLMDAKRLGDILIVGLNSDASVRRLKGSGRPLNNERDRAFVLSGFDCVDFIVIFNEKTPHRILSIIKPDVLIKGGDYRCEEIAGKEFAKEIVVLPYVEGYSTSALVEKMEGDGVIP